MGYPRKSAHDLLDHWNNTGLQSEPWKEAGSRQEAGRPLLALKGGLTGLVELHEAKGRPEVL